MYPLVRYIAIFSPLEHIAMVAEAPDHHMGGLGRVEEVRNGLNGIHLVGYREELNRNYLVELFLGFRKWCKLYYYFNKVFIKLLSYCYRVQITKCARLERSPGI